MQHDFVIIPLGTRCSAAGILAEKMNLRFASFPFDWIDIPFSGIYKLLQLDPNNIENHLNNYFNDVRSQRHPDGGWFPHDFISYVESERPQELIDIKAKYTRRFKRFYEALASGKQLVFFTVCAHYLDDSRKWYNEVRYDLLKKSAWSKTLEEHLEPQFISVNVENRPIESDTWRNFVVPLEGDFPKFEARIVELLYEHPRLQFLKKAKS